LSVSGTSIASFEKVAEKNSGCSFLKRVQLEEKGNLTSPSPLFCDPAEKDDAVTASTKFLRLELFTPEKLLASRSNTSFVTE
jgi:hypothetical protein